MARSAATKKKAKVIVANKATRKKLSTSSSRPPLTLRELRQLQGILAPQACSKWREMIKAVTTVESARALWKSASPVEQHIAISTLSSQRQNCCPICTEDLPPHPYSFQTLVAELRRAVGSRPAGVYS